MIVITSPHAEHDPERLAPLAGRRYWEVPARADALLAAVRQLGHEVVAAHDHGLDPIRRVHDAGYLDFLAHGFERFRALPNAEPALRAGAYAVRYAAHRPDHVLGQAGYYLSSLSAPILPATWQAALGAAHAAIDGADLILRGERSAYALCRPPGHHAHTDLAGGFCYLNNAAIAAQRLLDAGTSPVAILDFDVHHGNGTQQIFYARDDVFYVSVHGDPAQLYPFYQGYADETGSGAGLGWNLNLPLPPGTEDIGFFTAILRAVEAIRAKAPAVLIVSMGFDPHAGDPTANLSVSADGFAAAGRIIASLGLPALLVQEGGYLVERLGDNLTAFLRAFLAPQQAAGG
jgi:acetoin utilization deacetylase AcuC-like enzyme